MPPRLRRTTELTMFIWPRSTSRIAAVECVTVMVSISPPKFRYAEVSRKKLCGRLSARDGSKDEQRFFALSNSFGQRRIGRLMRQILGAGKEAQKRAALQSSVVTDRAAQHGITAFECIEDSPDGHGFSNLQFQRPLHLRERAQVKGDFDLDQRTAHDSVCTSTDSTAGRSRTMGFQWSPPSGEQYT